ncbi:MAG: hypothetical protein ACI8YQ_001249 [Polaribacter sp.]|jgi:hypothetical protein
MQVINSQNEDWRIIQQDAKKLFGPNDLSFTSKDVIVLVRVRNGAEYMVPFVQYYLKLGVRHLFFLDNGSDDNTVELAKQFEQVTVLTTTLPYKKYKVAFFHFLLRQYGMNCWSLVVDIDEFFDYPFSEFMPLPALIDYLDEHQYKAVVGQMLDLFPKDLPLDDDAGQTQDFLKNHTYYDVSAISKHQLAEAIQQNDWSNYNISIYRGGIRKQWFGLDNILLSKFPLVRYSADWNWESIHRLYPCKVADFSVALYHYKFRSDFKAFVEKAVTEENYNRNSAAYKKILDALHENKILSTSKASIQQLTNSIQLVEQSFLETSATYLKYTNELLDQQINSTTPLSDHTKQLFVYQQQLLNMVFKKMKITSDALSEAKRIHHEEITKEVQTLKNTQSWKLGNAIVKPIKSIVSWLPFWKK